MKSKLSTRLSPQAKKAFLRFDSNTQVSGLTQLSATVDIDQIRAQVNALGGKTGALSTTTNQLSVTLPAGQLNALTDLEGIVYFELAQPYSP